MNQAYRQPTLLSRATEAEIIKALWAYDDPEPNGRAPARCSPYLEYYHDQCGAAKFALGRQLPVDTPDKLRLIIQDLHQGLSRSEVKHELAKRLLDDSPSIDADDEALDASVDLAVRLAVMVSVGLPGSPGAQNVPIRWTDEAGSLQQFVASIFAPGPRPQLRINNWISHRYKARNLALAAGMQILFMSNLADHLKLVHKGKTVLIFHHSTFLEHSTYLEAGQSSLFPDDLMHETLSTLAILLPQSKDNIREWHDERRGPKHLDEMRPLWDSRSRNLGRYHFWRDRLILLMDHFDTHAPETLSQVWHGLPDVILDNPLYIVIALNMFFNSILVVLLSMLTYKQM